ncbi:TIGR02710 family CRISPR-associated protein [Methanospirillum sp. J.3.6.1-F.2.7.3]|uniref:TIGR02710 family CRISPR-associated protein n=1 Tax=Methanospirillum purgamenti TaxID=2834276 RepID=A0A8E7EJ10_9EURY|nr:MULTISPECIES: TIGR02710 family CRISPR-associated CARF protein [Methanospirillum]MDX8551553.1 TIGR02710 family CRISPR-associated CARF protein [Methanospirillum hungatei]QVV87960.1 TIGR02710 family CRISPR-associated protein [Methanospirillum sp. J.3.6.1-F.2.7.3]
MLLLMTLGTGIGTSHADALSRLVRSCSYAIHFYHPEKIIYFCSEESKGSIDPIHNALKTEYNTSPPSSTLCMIRDPNDFNGCFEVMYGVASLYQYDEMVIEASTGTREMILAAEIVSFLTRNPVSHVTGDKPDGMIIPGTEMVKEMVLFAAYDRLLIHRAIYAFNNNHYGSSLRLLEGISNLPERDMYYTLFNGYWHWDKMDYEKAWRYLQHVPDLDILIPLNRKFLKKLLDLDRMDDTILNRKERLHVRQQKYTYMLIDLLHNAKRRIDGERYDDALARLYRVVELISQVLLLNYGIDDNEEKIRFSDLRKLLKKQDISTYARKADRNGIIRIGLRYKFLLLEDLGMKGADQWYSDLQQYIMIRNDSILAHGLTPVPGDIAHEMWSEVRNVITKACKGTCEDLEELYRSSEFPILENHHLE